MVTNILVYFGLAGQSALESLQGLVDDMAALLTQHCEERGMSTEESDLHFHTLDEEVSGMGPTCLSVCLCYTACRPPQHL